MERTKFWIKILPMMLVFGFSFAGCTGSRLPAEIGVTEKGDKILLVKVYNSQRSYEVSEIDVIKEALEKGGEITVDTTVAREIDPDFDSKYTVANSRGTFLTRPAILNFIGGQGWRLLMGADYDYIFVKSR